MAVVGGVLVGRERVDCECRLFDVPVTEDENQREALAGLVGPGGGLGRLEEGKKGRGERKGEY